MFRMAIALLASPTGFEAPESANSLDDHGPDETG